MRARSLLLCLLIAACGGSKGEAIKLGNRAPAVGDVETTHQDSLFQATISSPRGQAELIYRRLADQKTEVLEVSAASGTMAKAKVTYVSESHSWTALGESEQFSPATTGHSYLVWREGGRVHASREDGSAPSDEELALVLADHHKFGVIDPMEKAITGRTWRRGERVTLSADELGEGSLLGTRITSLAITLRRVEGGVAHFEMHMGMVNRLVAERISTKVSGVMKIDVASGELIEIAGGGPVEGRLDGMPFSGHATILMEQR